MKRGLLLPWAALTAAALLLPWFHPAASPGKALEPGYLWTALWPVALGALLTWIASSRGIRPPPIPPGDLLILGDRGWKALAPLRQGRRGSRPPRPPRRRPLSPLLARMEGGLSGWGGAGFAFLSLILLQIVLLALF